MVLDSSTSITLNGQSLFFLEAQELNAPVILGVSEGLAKYMTGFTTVVAMVKSNGRIFKYHCTSSITLRSRFI